MKEIDELLGTMQTLRDPVMGCPWDREQTIRSILPYSLEEVYELADAVERDDLEGLRDELGDLLFHISFYAQIASEQGGFDFAAVARSINNKLRTRHPHVFAGGEVQSVKEQTLSWEKIKQQERKQRDKHGPLLADIHQAQPAITRAHALQKRAATVGFDWSGPLPVLDKVEEEVRELRQAIESGTGSDAIMDELGDVIFACVNLARHTGINPEIALRRTNRKFEQRFGYIERQLTTRGQELADVSLAEMEALWQEAKQIDA